MRRIIYWLMGTATVLVLLFSYHTSLQSVAPKQQTVAIGPLTAGNVSSGSSATPSASADASAPASTSAAPSASSSSSAATSTPSTTGTSGTSGTFTGTSVDTRFGPVQVQITVSGGKITASNAVVYPTESGRDRQINAYAVPALNKETLAAQSSSIDMVSGATYTSQGYLSSLQSALDQAHL
ncbi:MAG: FMN-binding protein [Acidobacteria bacterium]|nr:FMN-binding protein [Acidobacteriota bacterium]